MDWIIIIVMFLATTDEPKIISVSGEVHYINKENCLYDAARVATMIRATHKSVVRTEYDCYPQYKVAKEGH